MTLHRFLPTTFLCATLLSISACKEAPDTLTNPSNNGDDNTSLQVDANGVPAITGANMPKSGENWHYVATNLPQGMDVSTPGPDRTWDLSKLVAVDEYTVTHVAPDRTAPSASFPLATMAEGDDHSSIYVYMRQLPNVMQGLGLWQGSNGFLMAYSRPDTTWIFPFRYGMKVASIGYGIFRNAFSEIRRTSFDTTNADAWGTLVLPNGTYRKTLRVALPSQIIDSSFSGGSYSHTTIDHAQSYLWYAPGKRFPVAAAYIVDGGVSLSMVMWDSTTVTGSVRRADGSEFGKRSVRGTIIAHMAERGIVPMPLTGQVARELHVKSAE